MTLWVASSRINIFLILWNNRCVCHISITTTLKHFCTHTQTKTSTLAKLHTNQLLHTHLRLPADEAPADRHLFTFVHHSSSGLAVHHSILVPSPGLAPALNPTTHTLQSGTLKRLHLLAVCMCILIDVVVYMYH